MKRSNTMQELFLTTADNIKIAINHYKQNNNSVVIICPGWFMTKDSRPFRRLSFDFCKKYDVISMDFRGHGKSGGFYTFTSKECLDLDVVVNYAINSGLNYKKIYLCGFSLGGAVALNYSAVNNNIEKVIAVSPPADFIKIENHMYSPNAWIPTLFKKCEPMRWLSIRAGFPFLKNYRPIDLVTNIKSPTLFIAGENDPTVFPWHTESLYNNAVCEKQYKLFKNANHAEDLYKDIPEEYMQ